MVTWAGFNLNDELLMVEEHTVLSMISFMLIYGIQVTKSMQRNVIYNEVGVEDSKDRRRICKGMEK